MGNTQSPPSNPRFTSACRAFTQHELGNLKSLFASLASRSQSNGRHVSLSVFQRMFDLLTQQRKDDKLTFEDLVIAKANYEKGTHDEIDSFIFRLLDVNSDGVLERSDLESVLILMFENLFSAKGFQFGSNAHVDAVKVLLNAATFSADSSESEKVMSSEDFRHWCSLLPSVRKFLGSLLMPPETGRPGSEVPELLHPENVDPEMLLLRKEYAWLIGGALSQQELEEWKLLYHSSLNGLSFSTFLGSISTEDPTLLIVKDKEGYIYGGYASQPWERHSDFYGDMKSFLFQLYPKASVFRPTGANSNIQWCAVNFTSESIPNGIGFGGKINHFGFFLAASFDQGQTFSCTTFGSPCLSKSTRMFPEVIECWRIVRQGGQRQGTEGQKGTVLERFKEDRNMLKMVGIAANSSA